MILHFEQNPGSTSEIPDSTEQIADRKWIWHTDIRIEELKERGLRDEGTLAPQKQPARTDC